MKFAVSLSGGKDSMLALHGMVEAGHKPVAPLVMYRREAGRGWVHGIACRHRKSLAVFGDDGYPYAVPLSYVYDNGTLYFHCAKSGHKSDAIRVCDLEAKPCSMALCQDIKKPAPFSGERYRLTLGIL